MADKVRFEYLAIAFFMLAAVLYTNIDKLPLGNPGNLKAADPFYHALITEGIINTGQWNYYDDVFSLGIEKVPNSQPPLFYLDSAMMTKITGIPVWVTLYIFICIAQAGLVFLVYLISKEVFENEKIALLAAGLSILPLPVNVWLYGLYIGLWLQVASNFFMLCIVWLFIRYLKGKAEWVLFFMGLCTSAIMLVHPQDIGMMLIMLIVVVYNEVKDNIKDIRAIIRKGLLMGTVPAATFLVLLPRFLFVWGAQGSNLYNFGFFGFRPSYFTREYAGGLVYPDFMFMPILLLVIFALGAAQAMVNRKKYSSWLYVTIGYFSFMYLTPLFVKDPYYFIRARSLTPFFVMPTAAYFIYSSMIAGIEKKSKAIYGTIIIILIIAASFLFALPQYTVLVQSMQGEHISKEKWEAYRWLHDNSDQKDTVLFFGGIFQSENIYVDRITAILTNEDLQKMLIQTMQTNSTPEVFRIYWGGSTVREVHKVQKSLFSYEDYSEPDENVSASDFDYIFFQNINLKLYDNPPITLGQAGQFFAKEYVDNKGFSLVYNKDGFFILKNEKKD